MSISNSIRRLKEAYREPQDPQHMRLIIHVYWRGMLAVAVFIIVCAIWFAITLVNTSVAVLDQSDSVGQNLPTTPFDRNTFDSIASFFAAKQAAYDVVVSSPAAIVDPSH